MSFRICDAENQLLVEPESSPVFSLSPITVVAVSTGFRLEPIQNRPGPQAPRRARVDVLMWSKTTVLPWRPYQCNRCYPLALFSIKVGTEAVTSLSRHAPK